MSAPMFVLVRDDDHGISVVGPFATVEEAKAAEAEMDAWDCSLDNERSPDFAVQFYVCPVVALSEWQPERHS